MKGTATVQESANDEGGASYAQIKEKIRTMLFIEQTKSPKYPKTEIEFLAAIVYASSLSALSFDGKCRKSLS